MPPYGILVPGYVIPRELYGYVRKHVRMSLNISCKIQKIIFDNEWSLSLGVLVYTFLLPNNVICSL